MNLIKRNSGFYPTSLPSINDILTEDLLDWDGRNIASIGNTLPSVNIMETEKQININLAAPGLKKTDFEIELNNNILSISAEHKEEKVEKDNEFTRKEFNYESFCRTFSLPDNANSEKIDASYNDGILHITIGKKEVGTPKAKSIVIK